MSPTLSYKEFIEKTHEKIKKEDNPLRGFSWLSVTSALLLLQIYLMPVESFSFEQGIGHFFMFLAAAIFIAILTYDYGAFLYYYLQFSHNNRTKEEQIYLMESWLDVVFCTVGVGYYLIMSNVLKDDITIYSFSLVVFLFIAFAFSVSIFRGVLQKKIQEKSEQESGKRIHASANVDLSQMPILSLDFTHYHLNEPIKELFKKIQNKLDYISLHANTLDVENAHLINRMGQEEVMDVLHHFMELEEEEKNRIESQMMEHLRLMDATLSALKEDILQKKLSTIQRTFDVLSHRYKKEK